MNTQDNKPLPFILLFRGRCGSTYLVEALDNHPSVRAAPEKMAALIQKKQGAPEQLQWARQFLAPAANGTPYSAIGFKTKLQDVLDPDGMTALLQELSARIIHMRRRNTVKMTVSLFNSVRLKDTTGDWNLYDKTKTLPPLTIDLQKFDEWLKITERKVREEVAFITSLALPTLTVYYEDLLLNETATLEQVFSFLGVGYQPVQGKAVKSTSDDLRDVLANFNDLRAHYAGTTYQPMFDEVLVASA
jgi:LPS sulfotransferase NodH